MENRNRNLTIHWLGWHHLLTYFTIFSVPCHNLISVKVALHVKIFNLLLCVNCQSKYQFALRSFNLQLNFHFCNNLLDCCSLCILLILWKKENINRSVMKHFVLSHFRENFNLKRNSIFFHRISLFLCMFVCLYKYTHLFSVIQYYITRV